MIIIDTQAMVLIGRKLHVQKGLSFSITEPRQWSRRQMKRLSRGVRRIHAKFQSEQYFDPSKEEGRQEGVEEMTRMTRKLGRQFGLIRYLVEGETYIPDMKVPWNERYVKYDQHTERYIAEELKKDAEFRLKERLEQGIPIQNWDPTHLTKNELYRQRWYLARACWYRRKTSYERKQVRASYRRGLRAGLPTTPEQLTLAEMLKFDRMLNEIDGCENEIIMSLSKIPVKEFFLQCEQDLKLLTKVDCAKCQTYSGSEFSSEREVFESDNDQWNMTDRQRVDIMRKCLVAGSGTPLNARQRRNVKRGQQAKQTGQTVPSNVTSISKNSQPKQKASRVKSSSYNPTGPQLGLVIGHGAQQLFKMVTGFGDYSVNSNSLMEGGMSPPMILNSSKSNNVIIRHREYLADVLSTTTFLNTSYSINPGLLLTFPWLSVIAASFEQYRIRGLIFEFKSLSSDAVLSTAANSALGAVIMATEYNSLSASYPDKRSMENSQYATSSKPSESFIHPIECAIAQTSVNELYVRSGPVSSGDLRLYDLGIFQIATIGQQVAGGVLGELWVTYEIEFLKPQLPPVIGSSLLTDHFQLQTVTNAHPLGSLVSPVTGSSIGCSVGISTIVFPPNVTDGNFLMIYVVIGNATSISIPVITYTTNCSALQYWAGDSLKAVETTASSVSGTYFASAIIQITGGSAVVTFATNGVLPTTITSGDLWITAIDASIITTTTNLTNEELPQVFPILNRTLSTTEIDRLRLLDALRSLDNYTGQVTRSLNC